MFGTRILTYNREEIENFIKKYPDTKVIFEKCGNFLKDNYLILAEEYSKISRRVMKTLDEDRPFLEEQHRKEQEKYVKIRQIVEEEMKELMEQMKELNENVIN